MGVMGSNPIGGSSFGAPRHLVGAIALPLEATAMAKTEARIIIGMACTECKERNYTTSKNKKNDPDRLTLRKFCRRCGKHTSHREAKV
jgi:large subunit ribosomal protein L33